MAADQAAALVTAHQAIVMADRFPGYDAALIRKRLSNWPLFDPQRYRSLHLDLSNDDYDSTDHFTHHGLWEGRPFTKQVHLATELARIGLPPASLPTPPAGLPPGMLLRADLGVYVSRRSNFFLRELAGLLAAGLRRLGLKVSEGDETTAPGERRRHSIVVAPHDFFLFGRGRDWSQSEVVSNVAMLSTEQPQTASFGTSLPYLLSCCGVLDLCWQTGQSFAMAGIPAAFYMPGLLDAPWAACPRADQVRANRLVASLPQAALDFTDTDGPLAARPLDVTFMATASPIRDDFLSRHFHILRDMRTLLIYPHPANGLSKGYAEDEDITAVNDFVLRRSKILLNIHRDPLGYFEIHRIGMQGMWNGCAVVTNGCLPHPYFAADEHYLTETLDRIPKLIQWLVGTPEGRREAERVRGAALARYAEFGSERTQSLQVAHFLGGCFGLNRTAS